jgi:hypothetical protein
LSFGLGTSRSNGRCSLSPMGGRTFINPKLALTTALYKHLMS